MFMYSTYRQASSNVNHTLVVSKIVDHSNVAGASPVGAAPTTSPLSTWLIPDFNILLKDN